MRRYQNLLLAFITSTALFILIIDVETATQSIFDGIQICVQTVIPALFPFIILVPIICQQFAGKRLRFMSAIKKICKLPDGAESILFFGLLGGYPMGAALISSAYNSKQLSKTDAQRMLGFCSNAGPAFLFGMVASLFDNSLTPWLLWGVHILSAIIVGYCTRADPVDVCRFQPAKEKSIIGQIEQSTKTMAIICTWVILFRMLSAFLTKWVLRFLSNELQITIIGILELSNGCVLLRNCISESTKFIICSCILAFGGLSVLFQTKSICGPLGIGNYFIGKILQCSFSLTLSCCVIPFLYEVNTRQTLYIACFALLAIIIFAILIKKRKKLWKNRSV